MDASPALRTERRREKRKYDHTAPMAELRLPGVPIYQLKLYQVSQKGAGVIVRPDSKLLPLIHVGQEFSLRLLSTMRSELSPGNYQAKVEHLTELDTGPYKGHFLMGLSLKKKAAHLV